MKILGLTGGIGSGKTTVAREFQKLKVPVFIADEQSKKLLAQDATVIEAVKNLLGIESYFIKEGKEVPNTQVIASKVFNDSELLRDLNAILHPAVRKSFEAWKAKQDSAYCVYEAAILHESGGGSVCDHILLIAAPEALRIQRVMTRDKVSKTEVLKRIANQWTQYDKLLLSDLVICNIKRTKSLGQVRIINEFMLNN